MKNKKSAESINNGNHTINDDINKISIDINPKSNEIETQELIRQLEVHQMELEILNEELKRAQTKAMQTVEKYIELFDFAPTGYFSLTNEGIISEINLYASYMLGKEKFNLINSHFSLFIANDSKQNFNDFVKNIFEKKTKQCCEIKLTNNNNTEQYVQLVGKTSQNDEKCLVSMVDISELKKLSEINETLLTSLPYPAMYIKFPERVIVAANKQAIKMGAKIGGHCWKEFGKSKYIALQYKENAKKYSGTVPDEQDIKCSFCLAQNCFNELSEQRNTNIDAFGLTWDIYWLKVSKNVFLHYAVNVTELKAAEEALKESEFKLRTVLDYTVDWVFWINLNDVFLYCSPSCEKVTGYTASDFTQNNNLFLEIIHPNDLEIFLLHKKREETNSQTNLEVQFRLIKKDGSIIWVDHVCKSVFDKDGKFAGIRGSNRDITIRKEIELQLINSEQKYKHLSENITDGVFVCKNGIFEYTNQSMNNIFGYKDTEMDGMEINELVTPEYKNIIKKIFYLNELTNQQKKIEINCFKKDETILNIEITLNFETIKKEIYGVAIDITEKKKIYNRNMVKAIIMTEEKEKTNFSKELHDGLGPLLSTVNLYLQGLERPKSKEMQHEIILKAEHVLEEALISLAEISNKMSPHLLSEYGLTSAIQGFIKKFERTSEIIINFNSNLKRRFELEIEAALYRVLIECIHNTLKHAKATCIDIDISDCDKKLYIKYKDNGIGFKILESIQEQKGLGLNNMENRIAGIGGIVQMYSEPGQGVEYQIQIDA